jgi:hypothetical protein
VEQKEEIIKQDKGGLVYELKVLKEIIFSPKIS